MFGELYAKMPVYTMFCCSRGHLVEYCLWLLPNLCYPAPRPSMAHDALEGTLAHQWVAAASLIPGVLLIPHMFQYVLCVCVCVYVCVCVCVCVCVLRVVCD